MSKSAFEIDIERFQILHRKITDSSSKERSSRSSADSSLVDFTACIFRLPLRYQDSHDQEESLYIIPHTVSIGPFHRNRKNKMRHDIEPVKLSYLKNLMDRTQLPLEVFFNEIMPLEPMARDTYSKGIELDPFAFVEMLILDGCFIIELFRKISKDVPFDEHDQIISDSNIYPSIMQDLIKFENQIPWIILHVLYNLTTDGHHDIDSSLHRITVSAFNETLTSGIRYVEMLHKPSNLRTRHLLDFFHDHDKLLKKEMMINIIILPREIPTITDLLRAGITVKPAGFKRGRNFMDVSFTHGTLTMNPLMLTESFICLLFNCMALEQCYYNSTIKHCCSYITLLNCLVNNEQDVKYLIEHKIIEMEKYSGTEDEVLKIFRRLGNCLEPLYQDECSYNQLFMDINRYHGKKRNQYMVKLIDTYFDSPWSVISVLAAFVLLVLTVLQTVYTILGYNHSSGRSS